MIRRIRNSISNRLERLRLSRLRRTVFPDIRTTAEKARDGYFAFLGEFGYELISWTPYLRYMSRQLGLRPNIAGRAGGQIFYPFAGSYLEVPEELFSDCFGYIRDYLRLQEFLQDQAQGIANVVHPISDWPERLIEISGCTWDIRDIHGDIRSPNYEPVVVSEGAVDLPFDLNRPFVVINNKTYSQHGGVVNVYRGPELRRLAEFLKSIDVAVVYNCFFDAKLDGASKRIELEDDGIFGLDASSFDMRRFYEQERSPLERNRVQVAIFTRAELVLGTQGGNAYMPAICGCDQFLLVRGGVYKDYKELERIYRTTIHCFYEVEHFFPFLKSRLTGRKGNPI